MREAREKENVLKYKLAYSGIILLVYIIGKNIPLYGIDLPAYRQMSFNAEELLVQTVSGDMYRSSVFAVGIFPSMISGLLVQLFLAARNLFTKTRVPPGKTRRITVMVTLAVAALQAVVRAPKLRFAASDGMLPVLQSVAMLEMVTGAMLLLWLSDRNSRFGIGGRTIFILVNILERISATLFTHTPEELKIPLMISALEVAVILVMENTEKRIPVQRISIHNIYADKNYLAVKYNPAGIMPVMFTTAVFLLPGLLVSLLLSFFPYCPELIWCQQNLSLTKPFGILVYLICEYLLTVGFCMLMINPKDITEQFLKSGDSIVNLHAGRDTRRYLSKVMRRLSFLSATVMGACMVIPLVLQLRGDLDSTLVMLPSSLMMLAGFSCNLFREIITLRNYDTCRPLF